MTTRRSVLQLLAGGGVASLIAGCAGGADVDPIATSRTPGAGERDLRRRALASTPAFVWLKGPNNSRATQIAAGRAYARQQLTATALGLSIQPWSMTLQEYPEIAELYGVTQTALGATPAAPLQMLFRTGRATAASPSPRRGLAEHIHP